MTGTTLAMVGATGGAGTTRLTVEVAGSLARTGRDVAILDAAFATQGLRRYVEGRPRPDLTAVLTGDHEVGAALRPVPVEAPGNVAAVPASAPFERVARAKTASAASALADVIASTAQANDVVIVDTPPVAANQAVAAVTQADRVAAVVPDSPAGRDGLALLQGRLEDVGARLDAVVATGAHGGEGASIAEADARVPELTGTARGAPTTVEPTATGAAGVARTAERALGIGLEIPEAEASALDRFRRTD